MVALCNYRISLEEVGRHLTEFKSSREFVGAVASAMEAHDAAYFDARILHRDISLGNIIITTKVEGLLIDWDLCTGIRPQETVVAHRPFMSAALLSDPDFNQGIEDDRESAFYVLFYLGLRYTRHNQLQNLESIMEMFHNVPIGAALKRVSLVSCSHAKEVTFECRPLDDLIKELRPIFSSRYVGLPSAAAFARYENMKRQPEVFADALVDNPVAQYETHTHNLKERGWLVDILEKYIDGPASWPQADAVDNHMSKRRER